MQLSNRQVFLIIIVVATVGLTIFFIFSSLKTDSRGGLDDLQGKKNIKIVVWGVDPPSAFSAIERSYEAAKKDVSITYVQLDESTIQSQLVNSLALDQGPDVIMIKNRTLARQRNFLLPAPPAKVSVSAVGRLFPTVVEQDFVDGGRQVYALPLSLDTLALFYNKSFFDQARLGSPPRTWTELIDIIPQLVQKGQGGQINRAAVGLGGSIKSVTNAGDIVPLLFLQYGLDLSRGDLDKDNTGVKVFDFYTQFSNPRSLAYTWSDIQPNDLQSFANRGSAMVIAYKRQLSQVINQNTFLEYGTASMPQIGENRVDYASYWGLAVPKSSKQSALAWDFVIYATTNTQSAQAYMTATKYPPALRSLIQSNLESPEYGVFAKQALTARSWKSIDDKQTRTIFSDMISSYLTGQADRDTALGRAQSIFYGAVGK